jgi:hypothetical protein
MYGKFHIDPASMRLVKEFQPWVKLPEEILLNGIRYFSLARLARELTAKAGIKPGDEKFEEQFWRNYTMFYRWMRLTSLSKDVRRIGRRKALYIPWNVYQELADVVRPNEAAAMIGESTHMLHYWAKMGRLSFVQYDGTQKMISRDGLNEFLERKVELKKKQVKTAAKGLLC